MNGKIRAVEFDGLFGTLAANRDPLQIEAECNWDVRSALKIAV